MKKYIFAAVFVLLALIIIFTSDYHAEAQTETPQTTTLDSPATVPPPQEMMTTTVPATAPPVIITDSTQTNGIVATAEALMGIEFAEGGDEPSEGFDNSGFIYYVLRENGYIACPRQISGQLECRAAGLPSAEFTREAEL